MICPLFAQHLGYYHIFFRIISIHFKIISTQWGTLGTQWQLALQLHEALTSSDSIGSPLKVFWRWASRWVFESFKLGTNLNPWIFIIFIHFHLDHKRLFCGTARWTGRPARSWKNRHSVLQCVAGSVPKSQPMGRGAQEQQKELWQVFWCFLICQQGTSNQSCPYSQFGQVAIDSILIFQTFPSI